MNIARLIAMLQHSGNRTPGLTVTHYNYFAAIMICRYFLIIKMLSVLNGYLVQCYSICSHCKFASNCRRGSLHESGLSFNPKRHFKLNLCLHGRLSWGLKDHGEWKSHSGLKLVSDSSTINLIFPVILALTHLNTWIKHPILQTIFISAIMNVDFFLSFIQEWNCDPSLHDSELTFHSGSSLQSGMKNGMNSIRNELQLNLDSCKQI